jgi:hypothetical protein
MTHKTITHKDVNQFEWCDSRKEALSKAAKLMGQGKIIIIGGKRARNNYNYHDIRMAAIVHNDKGAGDKPWVIAWHD